MKLEVLAVDQREFAARAYMVIVAIALFVLGFFAGMMHVKPDVTVSVSAEQPILETPIVEEEQEETTWPIDLNLAKEADFMQLPGIGPELAERIVTYRAQVGRFIAVEQLMDVKGIGEKRFEEIRDLITVGGE